MREKMWYRLYRGMGWSIIGFAFILLSIRGLLTVYAPSEEQLRTYFQKTIPLNLTVKSVQFYFRGWDPIVKMQNIELTHEDSQSTAKIKEINAVVSLFSLLARQFVLKELAVDDAIVDITISSESKPQSDLLILLKDHFHHVKIQNSTVYLKSPHLSQITLSHLNLQMQVKNNLALEGQFELKDFHSISKADVSFQAQYDNAYWETSGQWQTDQEDKPHSFMATVDVAHLIHVRAWDIDIENAVNIAKSFDIEPIVRTSLDSYVPKGNVSYMECHVEKQNNEFSLKQIELAFDNVTVQETSNHPGASHVAGALRYSNKNIQLHIDSHEAYVQYSRWFHEPIPLHSLQLWVNAFLDERNTIHATIAQATAGDLNLSGILSLTLSDDITDVDVALHSTSGSVKQALTLLPMKIMDNDLVTWLNSALQTGNISEASLHFRGQPDLFPFDNHDGIFEAHVDLNDATLQFQEGWPALTHLDTALYFHNRQLDILAPRADFEGGKLVSAYAFIPNLLAPVCQLKVDTRIHHQLEQALPILMKSPLQNSVGKSLSPLEMQGKFSLDLKLNIPLSAKLQNSVEVEGLIHLQQANVKVPEWDVAIANIKGDVEFTHEKVSSKKLTGRFFDDVAMFDFSTQQFGDFSELVVHSKGNIRYPLLSKWLGITNDAIKGRTDYDATLTFYSHPDSNPIRLQVTSPLKGIEVMAPFPMGKTEDTERPMVVDFRVDDTNVGDVKIQYGEDIALALGLKRTDRQWNIKGGQLHFGKDMKSKERSDGILLIDGELVEVNADAWKAMFEKSSNQSLSLEPLIALRCEKLTLLGESFLKNTIEADRDNASSLWNIHFDGPSLRGYVTFPQGNDEKDIVLNLDKLALSTQEDFKTDWVQDSKLTRSIDVKIKQLKINKKMFNNVEARIEPTAAGYQFPQVHVKTKHSDISLTGEWDAFSPSKAVRVSGNLTTKDTSEFFKSLGIAGTIQQAKGTMSFSLTWQGTPVTIDYPTLIGKAEFNLNKGYVQGVNPGLGRVLNLLSIDSVQRRLNFDFNDVTKNGFVFDEFSGKFQFGKGKVSTNKLVLRGPSANIEGHGQADLTLQDLKGEMIVMPNVTGSLPVAAAIAAGNPAVGAAVWMADKVLGKKLQSIHRYRYRLLGTWDAPKLESVSALPLRRA